MMKNADLEGIFQSSIGLFLPGFQGRAFGQNIHPWGKTLWGKDFVQYLGRVYRIFLVLVLLEKYNTIEVASYLR
jgi:hypothetical protein